MVEIESDQVQLGQACALYTLSDVLRRRYLVRDLLWCEACDLPWMPILLRPMTRYYACLNKGCPLPAMPARLMEHRIWGRFVRLRGTVNCQVPREQRHEVLSQTLDRVMVCQGLILRLEWCQS